MGVKWQKMVEAKTKRQCLQRFQGLICAIGSILGKGEVGGSSPLGSSITTNKNPHGFKLCGFNGIVIGLFISLFMGVAVSFLKLELF